MKHIKLISIPSIILLTCSLSFAETKVYFSPRGGCTDAIISEVKKAEKTIDILMYAMSSRPIATELIKAKKRGVVVRILADKAQRKQHYSSCRFLKNNGIDVRYATGSGLMHNKVGIIDGKILITGSFNWTAQAESRNAENLLVIDDATIIEKYQEEFEKFWDKGVE